MFLNVADAKVNIFTPQTAQMCHLFFISFSKIPVKQFLLYFLLCFVIFSLFFHSMFINISILSLLSILLFKMTLSFFLIFSLVSHSDFFYCFLAFYIFLVLLFYLVIFCLLIYLLFVYSFICFDQTYQNFLSFVNFLPSVFSFSQHFCRYYFPIFFVFSHFFC